MKPKIFSCGKGGALICGSAQDLKPAANGTNLRVF
jgi:hypothetical protein